MKYSCAVVGLGRIGCGFDEIFRTKLVQTHTGAYLSNSKTNLVALCDVDKKKIKFYGKKFNIDDVYYDFKELLSKQNIDLLSICTHADTHLPIVEEATKHNIKGIFLEKPISNSLSSAKKIIKLCEKKGIVLQINHQRRFDPFYQKLKKNISNKTLGRIQLVNVYYGGGVANTGSHVFDLIRFFFGDVKSVQGSFGPNLVNISDPNINGIIYCKNNTTVNLQFLDYTRYNVLEFDIFGTNGRIIINLTNSTIKFSTKSTSKPLVYNSLIPKPTKKIRQISSISKGLENLITAIQTNSKPMCTGFDGYNSLEIILGLMQSAKNNNKLISMPIVSNLIIKSR